MQKYPNGRKVIHLQYFRTPQRFLGGLLAAVIVVGLTGLLLSNQAASNYTKQQASFTANAKKQASIAGTINISKAFDIENLNRPDNLSMENASCATAQTLDKDVRGFSVPKLSSNPVIFVTSFLSAKYRTAHRSAANDTLTANFAAMNTHLQRLDNACKVVIAENNAALTLQPYLDQRNALIMPCDKDPAGCVFDAQVPQYRALDEHVVAYEKAELAIYDKNCVYPELKPACGPLRQLWATAIADETAYINALVPGNDFGPASQKSIADTNKNFVAACRAFISSQPKLYAEARKVAGADCTDQATSVKVLNQAEKMLLSADETAIHRAAAGILK